MATVFHQTGSGLRNACPEVFHTMTGIQVLAAGSYVPDEIVRNEDLALLGYDPDWIFQRTGIRERRRATPGQASSDLAYIAAQRCLASSEVDVDEIDLLLVATCTPDTLMPSTACHLQRRLGARAAAMDLNAACAGFMYALTTGAQFVKTGYSRRALVVGADTMLRTVHPDDKQTFPLFGDGAGAVLLGAGEADQGFLSYMLGSDGEGADLLCIPGGGFRDPLSVDVLHEKRQFMQMEGRAIFKWAVRTVADTIRRLLRDACVSVDQIDALVMHQANVRILDAISADLGLDSHKVCVNLQHYGNTSAGSIPLVLDEALAAGRIARGAHVILCGFGAGLTWGAALMRW